MEKIDQELTAAETAGNGAEEAGPQPATPENTDTEPGDGSPEESIAPEDLLAAQEEQPSSDSEKLALLEAIVYVTDEPLTVQQIASAMGEPVSAVQPLLDKLVAEFNRPEHGLSVREIAGGYKISTKPEHHEAIRTFVKKLNPPLKLSFAALETLAVIAYRQPITGPEIMEVRGVQGAGVLKTLLDRKLITTSGRKAVVGRPIMYKTSKEFLVQFGLKDLSELPSLKEFEELRRQAFTDDADNADLGDSGSAALPETPAEESTEGQPDPAATETAGGEKPPDNE